MSELPPIIATPWKESSGVCDCCGGTSKKIWGELSVGEVTTAVYFVHWTVGSTKHFPNIDLILGPWGEGAKPESRVLVSLLYRPAADGGSFMIIDAQDRVQNYSTILGQSLRRVEVVGTPLAPEVFQLVDAVWLTDPRIAEVEELNNVA